MRPAAAAAVIGGGYALAALVAAAAVAVRVSLTSSATAQAASGMLAFGDLLLFVGVFGAVAIAPTVLALVMLRRYPRFWTTVSLAALLVAATGFAAIAAFAAARHAAAPSELAGWSAVAVLRMLAAPCLALAFAVCAAVAPQRSARRLLVAATAAEVGVGAYAALTWLTQV